MISSTDILNAKLLIVDDHEEGARSLKLILEAMGHTNVTYTTDPYSVYELHRANHYQVILLELQMPGMDGFQVMKDLNALESEGYVPVLAITGEPAYKLQALKAGAKDF